MATFDGKISLLLLYTPSACRQLNGIVRQANVKLIKQACKRTCLQIAHSRCIAVIPVKLQTALEFHVVADVKKLIVADLYTETQDSDESRWVEQLTEWLSSESHESFPNKISHAVENRACSAERLGVYTTARLRYHIPQTRYSKYQCYMPSVAADKACGGHYGVDDWWHFIMGIQAQKCADAL